MPSGLGQRAAARETSPAESSGVPLLPILPSHLRPSPPPGSPLGRRPATSSWTHSAASFHTLSHTACGDSRPRAATAETGAAGRRCCIRTASTRPVTMKSAPVPLPASVGQPQRAQREKVPVMTDVACFCNCLFSFDGDAGACPKCGEVASVTGLPVLESSGCNRPETPDAEFRQLSEASAARQRPLSA